MKRKSTLSNARLLLLLLVAGACADGSDDGCDPAAPGCSADADLAIERVIVGTAGRTHPVTGLRVVDSLRIAYEVRNRGRTASAAVPVTITAFTKYGYDTVPALEANRTATRSILLPNPGTFHRFQDGGNAADKSRALVTLETADSDDKSNDALASDSFHLALPIIELFARPIQEPRIKVNDPIAMSVTIANRSAVVAARSIQIRHCLYDFDVGCWPGNWTAFGNVPVADLQPGESRTIDYVTAVTPTGSEQDTRRRYTFLTCLLSRSDSAAYFSFNPDPLCTSPGFIEIGPDFEACAPPLLSAQVVTLSAPNCGWYPLPTTPRSSGTWEDLYRQYRFYLVAIDAQVGVRYRFTGVSGPGLDHMARTPAFTADSNGAITYQNSGRYYFIRAANFAGAFSASAVIIP